MLDMEEFSKLPQNDEASERKFILIEKFVNLAYGQKESFTRTSCHI